MGIIAWLIVGILAGFIASKLTKGAGSGLFLDLALGVVGSVIGGWLFQKLGITMMNGMLGSIITAVVGAVLLIWIVSAIRK